MSDWPPAGESFAVSDRASSSARLERAYRRLVACYPRSFRRENTEEIIAVLLATAREDQRRPSLAEAADLLRGAARMRLGLSRCPRTVLHAVRLMYLGALAEIALLVTTLLTAVRIQAAANATAIHALGPHATAAATQQAQAQVASAVSTAITVGLVVTPVSIALWILLAWANGKGSPLARVGAIIACAFYTAATIQGLVNGAAVWGPRRHDRLLRGDGDRHRRGGPAHRAALLALLRASRHRRLAPGLGADRLEQWPDGGERLIDLHGEEPFEFAVVFQLVGQVEQRSFAELAQCAVEAVGETGIAEPEAGNQQPEQPELVMTGPDPRQRPGPARLPGGELGELVVAVRPSGTILAGLASGRPPWHHE
jgi:hypothetical protein